MTDSEGMLGGPKLSERTGIDTSFWDYLSILLSTLICLPFQLVWVTLVTRLLGAEGYGRITLYHMVIGLGLMISVDWTAGSVLRFGREEFEHRGKMNRTFWARAAIMAPCLFLCFLFVLLFNHALSGYIGIPFWAAGILIASLFIKAVSSYVMYILQAVRKMRAYAAFQVIGAAIPLIGLGLMALGVLPSHFLTVIIVGIVSAATTLMITGAFSARSNVFLPVELNRPLVGEIGRFSYPIILASVSAYVVNWVDVMTINRYLSMNDVGRYQLAYQVFTFTMTIILTVNTLTGPALVTLFANGREDLILRYARRFAPQVLLIWSVFAGSAMAVSPLFFHLVFGRPFAASSLYFQFLALGLALNGASVMCTSIIMTYKLIKSSMVVNITMALLNLLGDFILVPLVGPVGAAISTSAAIAASAFLNLLICQKCLKTHLSRQLLFVLPAFLSFGICRLITDPWAPLLSIGATVVCGYYLAKRFRLFQLEDLFLLDYIRAPAALKRLIYKVFGYPGTEKQFRVLS